MANTIILKGDPVQEELKAAAAFTPGMLLELTSTARTAQKHATEGGSAYALFALEDENQGKEISDAYSTGNEALCGWFKTGDKVNALLANGETAVIGSKLESKGDGYLKVVASDVSVGDVIPHSIIAVARVALDMSGSSGADPASQRIAVTII